MTTSRGNLTAFRELYLDYLEGERDAPPVLDGLDAEEQKKARQWIASINAARGINPYATRPSTAELVDRAAALRKRSDTSTLARVLRTSLESAVDATATVVVDEASSGAGLSSSLVAKARGFRVRVVQLPHDLDVEETFNERLSDIAAIFGAFPDTLAVLIVDRSGYRGAVVDQYDIVAAIETPSGRRGPPRIRRAVEDPGTACARFFHEAMPRFEPFEYRAFAVENVGSAKAEVADAAEEAVADIIARGRRARLEAKQNAWTSFAKTDGAKLSSLLAEVVGTPLDADDFRDRVNAIADSEAA